MICFIYLFTDPCRIFSFILFCFEGENVFKYHEMNITMQKTIIFIFKKCVLFVRFTHHIQQWMLGNLQSYLVGLCIILLFEFHIDHRCTEPEAASFYI